MTTVRLEMWVLFHSFVFIILFFCVWKLGFCNADLLIARDKLLKAERRKIAKQGWVGGRDLVLQYSGWVRVVQLIVLVVVCRTGETRPINPRWRSVWARKCVSFVYSAGCWRTERADCWSVPFSRCACPNLDFSLSVTLQLLNKSEFASYSVENEICLCHVYFVIISVP